MRRLLPAGQSVQLPDAACGSETPTRAIDADIVVDQVALGACFGGKPTSSFHPIDFQTIPLHWACPEVPFANQQSDQRSISKAVRYGIPHADPPDPFVRISQPSTPRFVEHLRVYPPLGGSSFHGQLAIHRAAGDHNETPLNDEFRLEGPGSHSRHRHVVEVEGLRGSSNDFQNELLLLFWQ